MMRNCRRFPSSIVKGRGASLFEVLSAMVIVSAGLLGISNLQSKALKSSQDAYFVSQATFLLDDIAERIRANHSTTSPASASYNFTSSMTTYADLSLGQQAQSCVGTVVTCTPSQMATYDVARWLQSMTNSSRGLPSGAGQIVWAGSTATITIRWKTAYSGEGNCDSTGTIGGATQNYRCVVSTVVLP